MPSLFRTFSPERLFTALDSTIVEVLFFIPGTRRPATTIGFGAVFTDVDHAGSTKIEFLDVNGSLLFSRAVPAAQGNETLSFLGYVLAEPRVFLVRITSGNVPLRRGQPNNEGGRDVVVMDDFIYGEPRLLQ